MLEIGLGNGFSSVRGERKQKLFLCLARLLGIRLIDTAQFYSTEKLLGKYRVNTFLNFNVVTKIGLSDIVTADMSSSVRWGIHYAPETIKFAFQDSLRNLKLDSCFGLLLHCISNDFDFSNHVKILNQLKDDGKVNKVGFSVDKGHRLPNEYAWADIIEVHASLLDDLFPETNQIILINGVFRDQLEKKLQSFVKLHPNVPIFLLLGTHRFSRLLIQIFKYRKFPKY